MFYVAMTMFYEHEPVMDKQKLDIILVVVVVIVVVVISHSNNVIVSGWFFFRLTNEMSLFISPTQFLLILW